ncbi:hypothetical protein IB642_03220 [Allofrancisella guangzhouensis]|uniref:Uncharacterized protein n=1 Tax=Allofrancisella guangzhouensis TaxID=594679 RepID=A0A0A8E3B3_9GAMM|nr:hypothetical protein [Allofrancisella guangzhouensis]AJC48454.1 hypothetical protein SD28_01695 [Allofrancisella guangzhouensis]MBK2027644.1 hypothetical protein [Allofrancisella guangzhouensis]MBK2044028.1 hypothetical protein [Allofrancisella guangzhouensis]MBK2046491.1 hypothetical protein [Allofrancisella guangzhouensis]
MSIKKCQSCGFMWHSQSKFGDFREDQCYRCGSTQLSTQKMPLQFNTVQEQQQEKYRDIIFNKPMQSSIGIYQGIEIYGDRSFIEVGKTHITVGPGSEKTSGCAVFIPNIELSRITTISTHSLTGCQCIAIYGRSQYGSVNVFFAHSRLYDKSDDEIINKAREFIKTHHQNQIYWGTDFSAVVNADRLHDFICETQITLSINLGCWARLSHCIRTHETTFFPHLGFATAGNHYKALQNLNKGWLNNDIINSKYSTIETFEPNITIISTINKHLKLLNEKSNSFFRRVWHDQRRERKILVLNDLLTSYCCGNLDRLVGMRKNTEQQYNDLAWLGTNNTTKRLVIQATEDAISRTRAFDKVNYCGIKEDGSEYFRNEEVLTKDIQYKVDMILKENL